MPLPKLPPPKGKGVALLAMKVGKPKDELAPKKPAMGFGGEDDAGDEYSVAGEEVIDAMKRGDGKALADAICALMDIHTNKPAKDPGPADDDEEAGEY